MNFGVPNISRASQIFVAFSAIAFTALAWKFVPHPIIVLIIGVLPVGIAFTLFFPYPFVLAFVIFSFFRIHEVFPQLYPLRIPQLLALGTLASLGWNIFNGKIQGYWSRELSIFGVFFTLVVIGAFLATNRGEAMASLTGTYVKIAIMVIALAWLNRSPDRFSMAAKTIVFAGITVGLVALSNKANGIGLVEGTRVTIGRDIGSMLGDPNDLSLVLLFPASFSLAMLLTKDSSKISKLIGLVGFIIVLSAVIATQSRGGLLGILSVMGVFGYRKVKSKLLLGFVGVIALAVLLALAGVSNRQSGGAAEAGIDESAMGRIHAWSAATNMALRNPLTGVGINNFISNYFDYSDFWDGQNHAVHSTWFGVLAETGILGLIVFVTMIGSLVRIALISQNQLAAINRVEHKDAYVMAQATVAGLAGFCVSGTFLTMGFTWPVYILMGLAVSSKKYVDEIIASGAALEARFPEYRDPEYLESQVIPPEEAETPVGTLYKFPRL